MTYFRCGTLVYTQIGDNTNGFTNNDKNVNDDSK